MDKSRQNIIKAKSEMFKALSHPSRLWIVETLANKNACVCELVEGLNVDFSTVSKHLSILKQAGIVEDEKQGKQVVYKLKLKCILKVTECIENTLEKRAHNQSCFIK